MLETVCEILVDAYKRNWITSRDGNISLRYREREDFWITPSGVRKQTLQPDQFKRIGITKTLRSGAGALQFNYDHPVLAYTPISANLNPSGELPLHAGLQREITSEVRVVVHVHPTYCVAAMHAGIQLNELVYQFPELSRYTRVAPNVGLVPPISVELANQCHLKLGLKSDGNLDYDIVGIAGHGVVAIDTSPWRAYEHVERLEHIAKIVLASGNFSKKY